MIFYRYEATQYYGGTVALNCETYKVIKETPCGYWVGLFLEFTGDTLNKRWMKKNSYRKFACKTKIEALESFIARRKSYIKILDSKKYYAVESLSIAESVLKKMKGEK